MQNLYGDILSDVAAQIAGSVGLAGSSNVGEECAMFEAIHGSAPRMAGLNTANPSGLLQGAVMMLNHLGETASAEKIQNAWLKTIEDGTHTKDVFVEGVSKIKVGTMEFADAVIANLGNKPSLLKVVSFPDSVMNLPKYKKKTPAKKELIGVDVFVHWNETNPDILAELLKKIEKDSGLTMITNRGIKVWPDGFSETYCTDHWRCRFKMNDGGTMQKAEIIRLLGTAETNGIDVIKTENLYLFDGKQAFSMGQGQ
jgi:isocitrate dehydrogenase